MKRNLLKLLAALLALILVLELGYCMFAFTDIPLIKNLRERYIVTAMSTFSHKWLATALLPGDVVAPVVERMEQEMDDQAQLQSFWDIVTETTKPVSSEETAFFLRFHELEEDSVRDFVEAHPEAIENGWENFYINEAGLDDRGTSMQTKQGHQVLAINAEQGLLAIRVTGTGYRGVLVIGKDPSRLKLAPSKYLGSYGQHAGDIARDHGGLVAMTASGFGDVTTEEGRVVGGVNMSGAAMHSGSAFGEHFPWGYKRIELREDNRLYITDAHMGFSPDCTDACEFTPALIVDGEIVVDGSTLYSALNPRCVLGQGTDEAVMLLTIEGRLIDSLGTDAPTCAEILAGYDCYQAMNVDGGTSAILWYEGEYITRCSNTALPEGRYLPNVWVYCEESVD